MAIQNRRGAYADFDPTKMLPGEYAVVMSGDPSDSSGCAVYLCLASGIVKRLVFADQFEDGLDLKQDELTFDSRPTVNSPNPVTSGGVYTALQGKQNTLTFDSIPTQNSQGPVRSGGVYSALQGKQNTLTFDNDPTPNSSNPVKSGGVYTALQSKQNTLTFDSTPTPSSSNPVTSGGIYNALSGKQDTLTIDSSVTQFSQNPVRSSGIHNAISSVETALGSAIDSIANEVSGLPGTFLALEYDSTQQYKEDDICLYNGKIYQCILPFNDYTTGTFNSSAWSEIIISDPIEYLLKFKTNNIADEYRASLVYLPGRLVTYDGLMYRCLQVTGNGPWTPAHWEVVSLSDLISDADLSDIAPEYDSTIAYSAGSIVTHDGGLYRCKNGLFIVGEWNDNFWEAITVGQAIEQIASNMAPQYNPNSTYTYGDYCIYLGDLYTCISRTSVTGAWDSSAWSQTSLAAAVDAHSDIVTNLQTALAPLWNYGGTYTVTYDVGDYVTRNGLVYVCKVAHSSSTWIAANWDEVTITDNLGDNITFTDDGNGNITVTV